jgi:hypothetical protein
MAFFTFFNKKQNQEKRQAEFERLLNQSTRWRYCGIQSKFLDADFGEAFLADLKSDKNKPVTTAELRALGSELRQGQKLFSRPELEQLSKEAGFNVCEAFVWEKEYLESLRNVSTTGNC